MQGQSEPAVSRSVSQSAAAKATALAPLQGQSEPALLQGQSEPALSPVQPSLSDQVEIQKRYHDRWMREPEQAPKLQAARARAQTTYDTQTREGLAGHRPSIQDLYMRNVATAFKGSMHWRFGGVLWLNLLIACGDVTTDVVHGLGVSGGVCRYGARTIAPLVMFGEQGHIKRPDFSDFQGPGRPCSAAGPHTAGDRKQPDRASPKDG